MKTLKRLSLSISIAALFFGSAYAQTNTLTQTALTAFVPAGMQALALGAVTGISVTPPTLLYVEREAMLVLSINGTAVSVARGQNGTKAVPHASNSMVLAGRPDWFYNYQPTGACTTAATYVTPWVDIADSTQWLCSTISLQWMVGYQNSATTAQANTVVASVNGLITPTGPLFHVTGTNAITGYNIPVGFAFGTFTIIPDGAFTTTTATNIAVASTAVVGRRMLVSYDAATGKFYPSY